MSFQETPLLPGDILLMLTDAPPCGTWRASSRVPTHLSKAFANVSPALGVMGLRASILGALTEGASSLLQILWSQQPRTSSIGPVSAAQRVAAPGPP